MCRSRPQVTQGKLRDVHFEPLITAYGTAGLYLKAFKTVALAESLGLHPTRYVRRRVSPLGHQRGRARLTRCVAQRPALSVVHAQTLMPLVVHASESSARLDDAIAQLETLSGDVPPPVVAFNAVLAACSRAKV